MRKKIKIIGCGVSGLTVGITLLEAGYEVEIITNKLPKETTSATAAAIWFPYEVKPKEKANKWSKESYNKFVEFCKEPNAGVSMIAITVLVKAEKDAWWIDALPAGAIRKAKKEEVPPQFPIGFVANVPLTETQLYLDFLLEQFQSLNGQLTLRKVSTLSEFDDSNSIIVNCAGLGSRELVNDQTMYAIQGQIVKAKPKANINCIAADFIFGDTHDKVAYVVPRKDCIVLGGTAMVGKEDLAPDPALTKGILERCIVLEPNLENIEIQSVAVGLRPGRPEIRLERVGNIIHNYGHGGGGFTVSWGCAMEVKRLIEEG